MKTSMSALVIGLLLTGAGIAAQTPAVPATQGRQAAPPPPPPAPRPGGTQDARSNTNIRVDVTVVDEGGPEPIRKTVTLTSIDGLRASSRSEAGFGPAQTHLNVDATPTLVREGAGLVMTGKIRTRITLRYKPSASGTAPGNSMEINLDLPVVLEDGKKVVASQTSDPLNRRVTVEVTATILK